MPVTQVLNPRRQLDKFSPQQLAAIAWSYAMVNFQAPELFEAVQEEAMRKPPLAEMLSKAGLLRGGSSLGAFGRGRGAGGAPYRSHYLKNNIKYYLNLKPYL